MSVDGTRGVGSLASLAADAARQGAPAADEAGVAKQFESLLVRQLLDEMPLDALVGGSGTQADVLRSMLQDALTDQIVSSGALGLAPQIERSLGGVREGGLPASLPPLPSLPAPSGPSASSARITSGFGARRDPIDGTSRTHRGVDLEAPLGTPIRALRAGVVRFAGPSHGYGNLVVVDHGGGLQTRYAHCQRVSVVPGERVEAGQTVGAVGATGRATGPHLHLEVRRDGVAVDPTPWLDRGLPLGSLPRP